MRNTSLRGCFRSSARSLDPTLLFEADEGGIERPLFQREGMLGDLLEPRGDAVGVLRPHRGERPQDDQVERALQKIDAAGFFTRHPSESMQHFY